MNNRSILLALDGSAEALRATDLSWSLAKQMKFAVTAQHVIDSFAAWKFLSYGSSGLISSDAYFEAYENICQSLRHLGEKIGTAYRGRAFDQNIDSHFILDEGDTLREICKRAAEHDLVIVGHRPYIRQFREELKARPRRSLCEELVHTCPRPLLIVQRDCQRWSTMRIVIGQTRFSSTSIAEMLRCASLMDVKLEIYHSWNFASEREEFLFKEQFLQHLPKSQSVTFAFEQPLAKNKARLSDMDVTPEVLVLTPIVVQEDGRRTCHGADLQKFLRHLDLPAILLWPCQTYFESGKGEHEASQRSTA